MGYTVAPIYLHQQQLIMQTFTTITFGIFVLGTNSFRTFASNEYRESNITYGCAYDLAEAIGAIGQASSPSIIGITGDATFTGTTASGTITLDTVNSNVGSFGSATQTGTFTVNAKGLITAASNTTISGVCSL